MKRLAFLFLLCTMPVFCQSNSGELRIHVVDPSGLGVTATVQIISEANQYRSSLATNNQGRLDVQRLPFGTYQIEVSQPGFAPLSQPVEIRSSIPVEYTVQLKLPSIRQTVNVNAVNTLIDPDQA
ncbi:MAG: carboxypeptidase-like regulatory domain-containing protein, partial [Candidatus Acidiferrales bacterium]